MKKMLTKGQMVQELKKEFPYVYEWTDEPGRDYKGHFHKGRVSFYVVSGSISVTIDGVHFTVRKGERLNVPPGVPHTGKVGVEGCEFIIGEEIKGDS